MADVSLPDGSIVSFPDDMAPDAISAAVKTHLGPPKQESYTGAILPLRRDEQGGLQFAVPTMLSGLFDSAKSAATLPGDAYLGNVRPGMDSYTPDVAKRAADFGMLAGQISPASRVGAPQYAAPPTARALKGAADAGYDAVRASGTEIAPGSVTDMATGLRSALEQRGFIAENAPVTHKILDKLTDSPPNAVGVSLGNIDIARQAFGNAPAAEAAAGGAARRAVDHYLGSLDPQSVVAGTTAPERVVQTLRDARGDWAAAQKSNSLTGELDRANTGVIDKATGRAQASNSGRNLDNAIRQRVESLLESPREVSGFSDAELEALNKVVQGGFVRNRARDFGNALGGGGGIGQSAIALGTGMAGGQALGPYGMALGLAPAVAGSTLKALENALARRSLGKADETIRTNSPLFRELLAQSPIMQPSASLDRNAAIARALAGGLLNVPPQRPKTGLLDY